MRNSNEISAELETRLGEFESCQDAAQRKDLAGKVEELTAELKDAQLSEAARKAQANQRVFTPKEEKELRQFSISKFLRQSLPGETMDGIEAEMAQEGKREFQNCIKGSAEGVFLPSALLRTYYYYTNASEANYGQAFVEQTALTYIGKLRNATIGRKLGVRYLDGLQGNIAFVTGGADAAWVAEEGSASKQKPQYSKAVMSPKRLQVFQGVTYDLMHQSSKALDNLIMEDMVKAHAVALDAAIFAGSGSSGQPTGVLAASGVNTITIDASNGGPLTHDLLVQMETEVGIDNGLLDDTLAYVSNAKVQGKLKTIPQIAGGTAFSAAIFGNWSEVLVGSWGGLQLIVDPYTAKANGVLEISAAAYHDVLVRTPQAFCKIVDITTV